MNNLHYYQHPYKSDTQSPQVYMRIHSNIIQSADMDKCIITCLHHHNIIESTFTALKLFYTLPVHPFIHSSSPFATDLFTVSMILPFQGYRIVGQALLFMIWLNHVKLTVYRSILAISYGLM